MAITAHAKTTLKLNEGKAIDATARSAVFGAEATGGDYKTLFIFNNTGSSAVTATIAVGDGIQGAGIGGRLGDSHRPFFIRRGTEWQLLIRKSKKHSLTSVSR